MDGRTLEPLIRHLKNRYGVNYVDMITEPGPDRILSRMTASPASSSIKKRVQISVEKHGSQMIAVIGHHDCAGNPVSRDTHIKQIRQSVVRIHKWGFGVPVLGLWINRNWQVQEIITR